MNLTDIIDRIEYSIAGMEGTYYLDERDNYESNQLKIGLEPSINLIDYVVIVNDDEIEISGIRAHLRYNVTLAFDSIDVVQDTCSYDCNVDFRYAYIDEMQERDYLRDYANDQIEADIRDGRNIVLEEPEFKVILETLQ